jgi:hypothetical protein
LAQTTSKFSPVSYCTPRNTFKCFSKTNALAYFGRVSMKIEKKVLKP